MYGAIYRIRNTVNGKEYYGQSVTPSDRWQNHYNGAVTGHSHCKALSAAIRKYGKDCFSFEELAWYPDAETLNLAEEFFIHFNNSLAPNGYNLMSGGDSKRHSEETRRRMSESQKALYVDMSEEERKERFGKGWTKLNQSRTGVPLPDEQKENIGKSQLRKPKKAHSHRSDDMKHIYEHVSKFTGNRTFRVVVNRNKTHTQVGTFSQIQEAKDARDAYLASIKEN